MNWQPCYQKRNTRICRSCSNARAAAWKQANKEQVKASKRAWAKANPDKVKASRKMVPAIDLRKYVVKTQYGLSWEAYEALYLASNQACSICNKSLALIKDSGSETAHVDHCHSTGKVRGILCRSCNQGIGYLNDSPERLEEAANYLRKSRQ